MNPNFLKDGYSFFGNKLYHHNLHRLHYCNDYFSVIFGLNHYFLLFFEMDEDKQTVMFVNKKNENTLLKKTGSGIEI